MPLGMGRKRHSFSPLPAFHKRPPQPLFSFPGLTSPVTGGLLAALDWPTGKPTFGRSVGMAEEHVYTWVHPAVMDVNVVLTFSWGGTYGPRPRLLLRAFALLVPRSQLS